MSINILQVCLLQIILSIEIYERELNIVKRHVMYQSSRENVIMLFILSPAGTKEKYLPANRGKSRTMSSLFGIGNGVHYAIFARDMPRIKIVFIARAYKIMYFFCKRYASVF
jgi:hypothetical protein